MLQVMMLQTLTFLLLATTAPKPAVSAFRIVAAAAPWRGIVSVGRTATKERQDVGVWGSAALGLFTAEPSRRGDTCRGGRARGQRHHASARILRGSAGEGRASEESGTGAVLLLRLLPANGSLLDGWMRNPHCLPNHLADL